MYIEVTQHRCRGIQLEQRVGSYLAAQNCYDRVFGQTNCEVTVSKYCVENMSIVLELFDTYRFSNKIRSVNRS